jgi:hypothetical protein
VAQRNFGELRLFCGAGVWHLPCLRLGMGVGESFWAAQGRRTVWVPRLRRVVVRTLRAGLAALSVWGCGSDAPAVPLCDGSAGLTLRVFSEGGGPYLGPAVREENGNPSFAVDGQCQYFISGNWSESGAPSNDYGWRQGSVDKDFRRTLERMIGVEDLSTINDCNAYSTLFDAPSLVVANARSSLICPAQWGRKVSAVFEAIEHSSRRLWLDGQPLDQDLHVVVWEADYRNDLPTYSWPSVLSLRDYVVPAFDSSASKRVTAADAEPLRQLREKYLRDIRELAAHHDGGGIQVSDGEIYARLFMRDALPYENETGRWPVPAQ